MVQAFRRVKSPGESIRVKLHGLDPNAVYTLTNSRRRRHNGDDRPELLQQGPAHRHQGPAGLGGHHLQEKALTKRRRACTGRQLSLRSFSLLLLHEET